MSNNLSTRAAAFLALAKKAELMPAPMPRRSSAGAEEKFVAAAVNDAPALVRDLLAEVKRLHNAAKEARDILGTINAAMGLLNEAHKDITGQGDFMREFANVQTVAGDAWRVLDQAAVKWEALDPADAWALVIPDELVSTSESSRSG